MKDLFSPQKPAIPSEGVRKVSPLGEWGDEARLKAAARAKLDAKDRAVREAAFQAAMAKETRGMTELQRKRHIRIARVRSWQLRNAESVRAAQLKYKTKQKEQRANRK